MENQQERRAVRRRERQAARKVIKEAADKMRPITEYGAEKGELLRLIEWLQFIEHMTAEEIEQEYEVSRVDLIKFTLFKMRKLVKEL